MSAEPRHFGPSEEDSREININNLPDDIMKAIDILKIGLTFTLYIGGAYKVYTKINEKEFTGNTGTVYRIDVTTHILKYILKSL